ncbi:MAG TPA: hypothetical protein VL688_10190 [Verrucomicrobiae bacterium]|nr:hypothetical protein [Verrucomicrobiae bacterium]
MRSGEKCKKIFRNIFAKKILIVEIPFKWEQNSENYFARRKNNFCREISPVLAGKNGAERKKKRKSFEKFRAETRVKSGKFQRPRKSQQSG